jgi:glycosyltransferase involved in cell wall biosynthesis
MVNMGLQQLAIIIPVYNAGDNIVTTYSRVKEIVSLKGIESPIIIFVNDASTDNSLQLLSGMVNSDDSVHLLDMEMNVGQNAALFAGIKYADTPLVMTIDDDFPFQPAEVVSFINNHLDSGKKITFGIPYSHKNFMSFFLKIFFPAHRNVKYHSSLRVFNAEVREFILEKKTLYPALFLGIKARDMRYQIMHSYVPKTSSRYDLFAYVAYYRTEITIISLRIFGLIFFCTMLLALSGKISLWIASLSLILWGVLGLMYYTVVMDYTKNKYKVASKNILQL